MDRKHKNTKNFPFVALIISIAIPLVIGGLGSIFTASSVKTWYITLEKPSFNPPSAVFGPVWSTLYILIGIAAFLIWRKRSSIINYPAVAGLYFFQLLLNLGWSFIFFGQRNIGLALAEIIVLFLVILVNAVVFFKINKWAGILFVPYILWVGFASFLTYTIYTLN